MNDTQKSTPRELPRRCYVDLYTPAEAAIGEAMRVVEESGGSPSLTDAVILLGKAKDCVADHVDGVVGGASMPFNLAQIFVPIEALPWLREVMRKVLIQPCTVQEYRAGQSIIEQILKIKGS